ncbi:MAG: hypothetical protein U0234_10010 [Sandaracinus sp.]
MSILNLVILWLCPVIAGGLAWLVLADARERRAEGLVPTRGRVPGVVAITVVAVALAGIGTYLTFPPAPPEPEALAPEVAARVAEREARLTELRTEMSAIQDELDELVPPPPADVGAARMAWIPWLVVLSLLLVMGAITWALFTDVPRALRDARDARKDRDDESALAKLSRAVQTRRWKDGVAIAELESGDDLDEIERVDFRYAAAYCALMRATAPRTKTDADPEEPASDPERVLLLDRARAWLTRLLDGAPNAMEARYLLGRVEAAARNWEKAIAHFEACRGQVPGEVPLAHDLSVCHLSLATDRLASGQLSQEHFDRVADLGVLGKHVPITLLVHRLDEARAHVREGKFADARKAIEHVRSLTGLDEKQKRDAQLACDAHEILVRFHEGDATRTLEATTAFLDRWLPKDLPPVDDQTADEYLFPAVDAKKLPLAPQALRGFLFLEAVTRMSRLPAGAPSRAQIDELARPLLRALQLSPRHREVLASLGALYYWLRPDRQDKALEWVRAAVTMGVRSPKVRKLLADAERESREQNDLAATFRLTAARYLTDPSVKQRVRTALREELGRFAELAPVLLEIDEIAADEAGASPTIEALAERARYLENVASTMAARGKKTRLEEAQREYAGVVKTLTETAQRLEMLEQRVVEEMGKAVLR